jgi:hypothetical protein
MLAMTADLLTGVGANLVNEQSAEKNPRWQAAVAGGRAVISRLILFITDLPTQMRKLRAPVLPRIPRTRPRHFKSTTAMPQWQNLATDGQ